MIRPVDTHWNTMCEVAERALELRPALDHVLNAEKQSKGKKKLAKLKLSNEEWELMEELKPMLKVGIILVCLN